jgi:predicted ATPase/DNA-binding SARP family transcriptional activator
VIRYGLLGPATVWCDGREVELGSPQQRALFALLLLHRNTTVSTDRMSDVLWPSQVPVNAVAVLRTYVARLRGGPVAPTALVTHAGGYELRVSSGEVDTDVLESRLAAGRAELGRGDAAAAEVILRDALTLVRGPVLPELPDDHRAAAERARLDELCAAVAEELIDARLAQGDHRELVPGLRAAVTAAPLRERGWAQLMVALYRCGRQADALDAYREAYAALRDVGIEPGPRLRQLERMILLQDSALELPTSRLGGVPGYATSLVGRQVALDAIEDDVRAGRLVSLVGPAGAGKTRLAAETAIRVQSWLGSRVWWVDLGAVGPGRVIGATSRALAVPQVPGRSPLEGIAARLGDGPGLLVLDNCEHVVEEAATLAAHLLAEPMHVRILATSREALRLGEERVHRLAGLEAAVAAQLFSERAEAPVDDAAAVAEIVTRLDGLPLAIELAAAKLRTVSVTELATGLRERLSLLADGRRDAPVRQRSLQTAIAWSYDLLPPSEQRLLRQLSVFAGTFDAGAAAAVAGEDVLPALGRLVDASLVAADPPRYRLLMTVRTFAYERLRQAGEADEALVRHRNTYLGLAEEVGRNMVDRGLGRWLVRGRLEHENFLSALRFSLEHSDADEALGLAAWLSIFWFRTGYIRDGHALLERAIAAAAPGGPLWPRALIGRAILATASGAATAQQDAEAAVATAEKSGPSDVLAVAYCWRGYGSLLAGRHAEARADLERGRATAVAVASDEGIAFADQVLGDLAAAEGDLEMAGALLVRSRDRYRRSRVTVDAGFVLIDLARVRLAQRRFGEALAVAGEAVADFRSRQDPRGLAGALRCLGQAYEGLGEPERARSALDESHALVHRWGGGALWTSGQPDEPGQEPALGAGVEPLAGERSSTLPAVIGEHGDGDIRLSKELR